MPAMRPEVMVGQADALAGDLRALLPLYADRVEGLLTPGEWASVRTVYVTGNGDSHHAALAAGPAFTTIGGRACRPMPALQFAAYGAHQIGSEQGRVLVIGVSASGGSTRVAGALAGASTGGALTVAVTGRPDSAVARAADRLLLVDIPQPEPSPGIRTYQASLLGLLLCAIELGRTGPDPADGAALRGELLGLAAAIEATAPVLKDRCRVLAGRIATAPVVSVLGSGPHYGTALFAAAKLIEGAGVYAVGQDLDEWVHIDRLAYPLDTPVILIAPPGESHGAALEMAAHAHQLGKSLIAVTDTGDQQIRQYAATVLPVEGRSREEFSPLLYHPFSAYLAAFIADALHRVPFQASQP